MDLAFRHLVKLPNGTTEVVDRGIRVYTILSLHASGDTPEEIADAYELPIAAVYEALAYAADHAEEMDRIRKAEAAIEREILLSLPEELRRGLDIP
jgi:uncharacterized protein (DUF433 family)